MTKFDHLNTVHEHLLELPETPIPFGSLSHILQLAHDGAVDAVNTNPGLYQRLTGKPALEMVVSEEDTRCYQEAASVLEAPYLSDRQQQVAATIAVLVGFNEQGHYTRTDFRKKCQARDSIIGVALSVLTGIRNEHTPPKAQIVKYPLLANANHSRRKKYVPTKALRWLMQQADEDVPSIFSEARSRFAITDNS